MNIVDLYWNEHKIKIGFLNSIKKLFHPKELFTDGYKAAEDRLNIDIINLKHEIEQLKKDNKD